MSYPDDCWVRALEALNVAEHDLPISPDATASRAYYAAFYAVSALFAVEGRSFERHSALESAVHRDLVKTGLWPADLGKGYSRLAQLRTRGDYGGGKHVMQEEAEEAIQIARDIVNHVKQSKPEVFRLEA